MNNRATYVFMFELRNQAEAATIAAEDLNAALAKQHASAVPRVFAAIQSLLAAGAMVSKILWPAPAKSMDTTSGDDVARQRTLDRGRTLRKALGVRSIPILESRKVRNSFEHYDDRLDAFLATNPGPVVDRTVGSRSSNAVMVMGQQATHLRLMDIGSGTVSVLEDEVDIQELFDAIQDIGKRANAWIARFQSTDEPDFDGPLTLTV